MKICIVTPRFAVSGVPLAQIRFAEALAAKGHTVDFLIGCVNRGLEMPKTFGVNVMLLNRTNVRGMLYPLWKYFHKNKPDVVFSAEDHLNAIVLIAAILSGSPAKISGSSRVTPYDTYSTKIFTKRWALKQVFRAVMWRANVLTCVSKDMVEQYRKVFRNAPHVCVYNIVDNQLSRQKMLEQVDAEWFLQKDIPVIVAAGQLEPWKGFADLIRAVKDVSRRRAVWLVIFGEGSLRVELERLIEELGLADNVKLPGNVANPLKYFTHAQVFALTSYVEGMPNALVEAMMCGCTPVATDCPTGPRELLDNGKYGYLVSVGDPISIARGIERALEKPIDKNLLAEAIASFEEQTVIARHFELLGLADHGRELPHPIEQSQSQWPIAIHLSKRGGPVANDHSPLKIAFVIKAMSNPGGGAERVLAAVSSGLADRGHNVTIITSDPPDKPSFYPLAPLVRRVFLGVGTVEGNSRLWDVLRRIWILRRKILSCEPDVVAAFMHSSYIPVGMALAGTRIPVVASEHTAPEHYRTRPFQLALVMLTPFTAHKITVVSEQNKQRYGRWLRRRMVVAPNPVAAVSATDEKRPRRARTVLCVGRLGAEKNHGCLIAAFALVASDFPDWTLRIVGDGELRGVLEKQIRELGLKRRVELPGFISDIGREYRNASFVVSASTYESFGLAIAEALLSGVPAVAFEDCPGTNMLIRNNIDGILVNESRNRVGALSIALRRLMADPEEIQRLSRAGTRRLDAYSLPRVLDTWEGILRDAAQAKTSMQFYRVKFR